MVQRITRAPPPRLTLLLPAFGLRTARFPFALRAFHLRLLGLCSHSLELFSLDVSTPDFAFRGSGLSRFGGHWRNDRRYSFFDGIGRLGRDRWRLFQPFLPLLRRLFACEGCALSAKAGSGRQRRNNAARQPIILSSFGCLVVLVLILALTRHDCFCNQAGILAHGSLDLACDVGILFQKLFGVLAALTDALAVV